MALSAHRQGLPIERDVVQEFIRLTPFEDSNAGRLDSPSFYRRHGKRLFDLAVGLPLCLLALPIVLVLAVLVIITSGWPAFYAANRTGHNGRAFRMWKLRTMVKDAEHLLSKLCLEKPELAAEYAANFKLLEDPRVTIAGKWLRKTSLDELPQLLNVIRGDMSLVGPRPYFAHELDAFPEIVPAIVGVKPGLTGPWQIGGRNLLSPRLRMHIDAAYATHFGLSRDLRYLLKTAGALIHSDGV